MIETPRAAMRADEIAEEADFFSFGTNDLTQMAFGFSRDDVESRMMPAYLEQGLLKRNPFETIDAGGVGELVKIGAERGRKAKPQAQARCVRRARRRPRVDRPVLRGRPRLRQLLAVPRADRPAGGGPGDRRSRHQRHQVAGRASAAGDAPQQTLEIHARPYPCAMAIADDDIERLRSTVSIVDLVGQFVTLRKVGRNWVGLCPFHAEQTPSFNVREETGRYRCFGCDKSGDVFTFVQEHEHVDFVGAVEYLAAKAGMQLTYTSTGQSRERARRKQLVDAMAVAVEWYHHRLLDDPAARLARDYLRSRGLSGDVARTFRLGWAPDEWDALARQSGIDGELLRATGLAFTNRSDRMQDAFRGRVLFPIFSDAGEAVAIGGRVLPGSDDPAKYKNSPETPIYAKSKTLYGLNWAKADVAASDQAVVCEGYTDVIGFHRVGVTAGRGHVRNGLHRGPRPAAQALRQPSRAGVRRRCRGDQAPPSASTSGSREYQVQVSVAQLPRGPGPRRRSPSAIRTRWWRRSPTARPFLAFRLQRVMDGRPARTPEDRARLAERAMSVVNEHPDANVRKLYAGQVASEVGLPVADLVAVAERGVRRPTVTVAAPRRTALRENAEFVAVALLAQDWESIAGWLVEELFHDETLPPGIPRPGGDRRRPDGGHRPCRPRGPGGARAGRGGRSGRRSGGRGPEPDRCRGAPAAGPAEADR